MVNSHAFRLVPASNESEMIPGLYQSFLHEIVRSVAVAA